MTPTSSMVSGRHLLLGFDEWHLGEMLLSRIHRDLARGFPTKVTIISTQSLAISEIRLYG